ncbi:ParB/RepB/Spo0J family partition protein [Bifidobacterium sp. ESL0798]|uniref:ParB/RepB/Spo0J family partition protein n=1 Tax=Bifidobacterium sp. ESL0798 TaxID=2983235 RepID=UPI0023F772E8|nr:ParB/RepB/Spo0J family partition protein [Bifidobacterium sp. ESL0798]WEV74001.1 ParB/RepB/Spo0J family partition protein [Bifidobacterium sp. ESL0798]
MAAKSRLGKGLGALFPALPGEQEKVSQETDVVSDASQRSSKLDAADNVSRETSAQNKVLATNKTASKPSKTSSKGKTKNVSRETSKKKSSGSAKSTVPSSSKGLALKSNNVKKDGAKSRNVSRETSVSTTRRRVSMPSLKEGMAHPSDLFFGATVGDGEIDTIDKATSEKRTKSLAKSANNGSEIGSSTKKPIKNNDTSQLEAKELKPVAGGYLVELDLDAIGPNANQPRTIFDEDELKELAASLKEVGVLQPVVVRKRPANQKIADSADASHGVISRHVQKNMDSEYELIMGERRWRAAHLAGLKSIPAIVKTTSDNQMLRDALLENLHRVALNPLEESAAYQQMMEEFGLTQEQLSKSVSKSRSQIANTLRLLNLPPSVQKKVAAGVLSAGHARALLGLPSEEDMEKLANRIIAEGLSVRSTEEIVAMKTNGKGSSRKQKAKQNNLWAQSPIQHKLENRFDTKVAIKGNKEHGRIEIVFSSPEDMDRIVKLLVPPQNSNGQNGWV